jgi:signal transduction histidine kinase/CheY-like chemotaxis protein
MALKSTLRSIALRSGQLPLRFVLVVPFAIQIFLAVGLTGWLSIRNGQTAVNEVARQLREEITARINQHFQTYLDVPHTINQINGDAIRFGYLNPRNSRNLEHYFWRQIQLPKFDSVMSIAYGTEDGEFHGVGRPGIGAVLKIGTAGKATDKQFYHYSIDENGDRLGAPTITPTKYDPRFRPWYLAAARKEKATWSEIYPDFIDPRLVITASQPVYDQSGQLQGVLSTDLTLSQIGEYLRTLEIGRSGETFIVEHSGLLVATSSQENPDPFIVSKGVVSRIRATASSDPKIHLAAEYLQERFGDFTRVRGSHQLNFRAEGEKQFLQVSQLRDQWGLNWLIVVVVPESDFMEQIQASTRMTILLCLGALVIALGLGLVTSRWIAQPILRLSRAAQLLSQGNWDQMVPVEREDEVGILAQAFNQMAEQLRASFAELEQRNLELENRVEARTADILSAYEKLQLEIVERQQVEEKLRQAKEAAEIANRAKSEFLANMSHELRTPLNGILGYAQILRQQKNLTTQQQDNLNIIQQCGEHLLTLINDILDLSKIEAHKLELHISEFNLPDLLKSISALFQMRAEQKGISFTYESLSPLPVLVQGDEQRLRQILINLLSNAVKFTSKGGVIFKVGNVESCKFSSLSSELNPEKNLPQIKLRFQVEDTGCGIASEHLQEIFLPFQQVGDRQRSIDGTGLGLPISKRLAEMMGSRLEVRSTLGEGSVFWLDLELPKLLDWQEKGTTSDRSVIGFKGPQRKILVVDDKRENRSFLVNLLSPLGFEVVEAENGQECLHKAVEFQPDAVLMDLVMPVMDGFEATRQIRQSSDELRNVVVIATSASAFSQDRQSSLSVGCDNFIPKPIHAMELFQKLGFHLELEWVYEEEEIGEERIEEEDGKLKHEDRSIQDEEQLNPVSSTPTASTSNPSLSPIPHLPEELMGLYQMALIGDIQEILNQSLKLEQMHERWRPFAQELRQLAKTFQIKKMQEFVKKTMENHGGL